MVFEEGNSFVEGGGLLFVAEEEKKQMDIYAGMISAEGNKSDHFSIVEPSIPTESIFCFCSTKNNASDDSTAASTIPSTLSSQGGEKIVPFFGYEVVKSFEDAAVAICAQFEQRDETSAARSPGDVQVTDIELTKDVKDIDTASAQMDDSEHLSAVFQQLQFQEDDEESETVEVTRISRGGKTSFSAAVSVSRGGKTIFFPDAAALPHGDVSYSPWLGVQLTEYDSMPEISEDEVLIKVEATTISTRDCLERLRRDNDEDLRCESWVPGHEIVGRVVRVGGEARFLKDRRVAALLPDGGGCSRYVPCHISNLIAVPERAPSQDLVHILSSYLPAYQCLEQPVEEVDITSCQDLLDVVHEVIFDEEGESANAGRRSSLFGQSVLIAGAGSPVGLALVDVARHAGAIVYALSHSENEQKIEQMGLRKGSWYPLSQNGKWGAKWSGKMDLIVDTVGDYGNYSSFYDVLGSDGRFVRMNITSSGENVVPIPMRVDRHYCSPLKRIKGNHINRMAIDYDIFDSFEEDKKLFAQDLTYLFHLLRSGKIELRAFPHVGFFTVQQEWNKALKGGNVDGVVVSCNEPKMRFTC